MPAQDGEAFPAFFGDAPVIRMRDPLAAFLGASRDGVLAYGYADAVRLAGHSCPTVASAWLMARAALRALFADQLPERGAVRIEMRDGAQDGVAGVIASVFALLTGATVDTGFKGIGGHFDRRGLLAFDAAVDGQARFTRCDNGESVTVSAHLEKVPSDPRTASLIAKCLGGRASEEERSQFHRAWQERVRKILVDHADDPGLIRLA
jgi:hypothetical protein